MECASIVCSLSRPEVEHHMFIPTIPIIILSMLPFRSCPSEESQNSSQKIHFTTLKTPRYSYCYK